jgi:ADP-ribose pyrophosphatase YjhB (NUDIX family)
VSREYPDRPFVGVGAVIVDEAARVLLVKRRFEPLAGQWSLPGGAVDVGETLEACIRRELREETGSTWRSVPSSRSSTASCTTRGRVQYHYVLVDYVCRPWAER